MILAFSIGFVEIKFVDILDVMFVTILLYQVYKLMRGSVAIRVFLGFLSLYLVFLVVKAANMELLSSILGQFMGVGVLAVIILFQQEIRRFLLLLGRTPVFNEGSVLKTIRFWASTEAVSKTEITPIVEAAKTLGGTNTGALMVFSKSSELKFYADSGDRLDAMLSKRLLLSIFNKYSPLHDGAAIIKDGRIVAARCILPVTERDDIPANFGLRHRAAIGMSEVTDVFIIIVSEETGQISTVKNGQIFANQSTKELRSAINKYLLETEEGQPSSVLEQVKQEEVTQQAS
ncbi:MAG: diadenylate cyclase CdaA [Cyclobacteriaceae bacterium]